MSKKKIKGLFTKDNIKNMPNSKLLTGVGVLGLGVLATVHALSNNKDNTNDELQDDDSYDDLYDDSYDDLYDDEPFYADPICPACAQLMKYSYVKSEYKCFGCGEIIDEYEADLEFGDYDDYNVYYDDLDDTPEGCSACGGPYPLCVDGCNLFDE